MRLSLSGPVDKKIASEIQITGSKSESNRLLLLQALYPEIKIENLSNADDAKVMAGGLQVSKGIVDIHHAGTAMRFLTSFFASQEGKQVVLTGSKRMTERPIKILVDALLNLGADISYEANIGYPPLRINGRKLTKSAVRLPANVSSQYISSLLLIAPSLESGLEIDLVGKITSVPYIKMTLALLQEIGVKSEFNNNKIRVWPQQKIAPITIIVESDWSSASYYYGVLALAEKNSSIKLTSYKENSLQGDSVLQHIYEEFGIRSKFDGDTLLLTKEEESSLETVTLDLANAPDIAQTIALSCFGLGKGCHLTGLHTLKIKETDRLLALKQELEKVGATIRVTNSELFLEPATKFIPNAEIATYNDHRMAMAFAPLAMKLPLLIENAEVVSKSYPDFWSDFKKLGFSIREIAS